MVIYLGRASAVNIKQELPQLTKRCQDANLEENFGSWANEIALIGPTCKS